MQELTDDNFSKEIKKGIFLIDFYAAWCGPCRMIAPILEDISKHFEKKAKVAKLDIEANQKIADEYQVTSVPTLILFVDGEEKNRMVGLRNFDEIKDLVSSEING